MTFLFDRADIALIGLAVMVSLFLGFDLTLIGLTISFTDWIMLSCKLC